MGEAPQRRLGAGVEQRLPREAREAALQRRVVAEEECGRLVEAAAGGPLRAEEWCKLLHDTPRSCQPKSERQQFPTHLRPVRRCAARGWSTLLTLLVLFAELEQLINVMLPKSLEDNDGVALTVLGECIDAVTDKKLTSSM